jgi:hypothetical protein
MDDATRFAAQEKLDNLTFIIGSPKWTNDTDAVREFHNELSFESTTYFSNSGIRVVLNL